MRVIPGTYHFRIPESIEMGFPVGRIKAEDDDIGKNAEMDYSIIGEEGHGTFNIMTDKRTQEGLIIVKKVNNSSSPLLGMSCQNSGN